MSHIKCHDCGSSEHTTGYGLACGPIGSYTICECGETLEFVPDLDGLDEQTAARIQKSVDEWRDSLPHP